MAPIPHRRDLKRTLILKLRRTVKVSRRFTIEQVGPLDEKQTCCECGYTERFHHNTLPAMAKKLIAYRAQGGGVTGVCPRCSKARAIERYPLPEDCACYRDCGADSASGTWHTHEGEPCPMHPSARRVR